MPFLCKVILLLKGSVLWRWNRRDSIDSIACSGPSSTVNRRLPFNGSISDIDFPYERNALDHRCRAKPVLLALCQIEFMLLFFHPALTSRLKILTIAARDQNRSHLVIQCEGLRPERRGGHLSTNLIIKTSMITPEIPIGASDF